MTLGNLQDELYIVAGVLAAVCFILLILVIVALIWTYRLRVSVEEMRERFMAQRAFRSPAGAPSLEDFENPRRLPRLDSVQSGRADNSSYGYKPPPPQQQANRFAPPPPQQFQPQQGDWGQHPNKGRNPLSTDNRGFPGQSSYPGNRNFGY